MNAQIKIRKYLISNKSYSDLLELNTKRDLNSSNFHTVQTCLGQYHVNGALDIIQCDYLNLFYTF